MMLPCSFFFFCSFVHCYLHSPLHRASDKIKKAKAKIKDTTRHSHHRIFQVFCVFGVIKFFHSIDVHSFIWTVSESASLMLQWCVCVCVCVCPCICGGKKKWLRYFSVGIQKGKDDVRARKNIKFYKITFSWPIPLPFYLFLLLVGLRVKICAEGCTWNLFKWLSVFVDT